MKLVVDCSVALKWFLGDQPGEGNIGDAMKLLSSCYRKEARAIQPTHWRAEMLGVLARVRPDQIDVMVNLLNVIAFQIDDSWRIYKRAAEISVDLNHHIFDTLYHAVALENGAELVTADVKYYNKAKHLGSIILLS